MSAFKYIDWLFFNYSEWLISETFWDYRKYGLAASSSLPWPLFRQQILCHVKKENKRLAISWMFPATSQFYSFTCFTTFCSMNWGEYSCPQNRCPLLFINVGTTIVNQPPPPIFFLFFSGGVASQLWIPGLHSPHKSERQIKTIQPQLNEQKGKNKMKPTNPNADTFVYVWIWHI